MNEKEKKATDASQFQVQIQISQRGRIVESLIDLWRRESEPTNHFVKTS